MKPSNILEDMQTKTVQFEALVEKLRKANFGWDGMIRNGFPIEAELMEAAILKRGDLDVKTQIALQLRDENIFNQLWDGQYRSGKAEGLICQFIYCSFPECHSLASIYINQLALQFCELRSSRNGWDGLVRTDKVEMKDIEDLLNCRRHLRELKLSPFILRQLVLQEKETGYILR